MLNFASSPSQARATVTRRYGPSAVPGPGPLLADGDPLTGLTGRRGVAFRVIPRPPQYRSATLLLWVLLGPVLKHGPRSLTCARVIGTSKTQRRNESEGRPWRRPREDGPRCDAASHSRGVSFSSREEAHQERTRWDPKDGELCLVRTKSGETLMEVRSDSDVQIDRRNWV